MNRNNLRTWSTYLLLVVTMGLIVHVLLQRTLVAVPHDEEATTTLDADSVDIHSTVPEVSTSSPKDVINVTETTGGVSVPTEGFIISIGTLPEAQQHALRALGYSNTVTVSAAAIACAEEKIGVTRVLEIKNGTVPTLFEMTKLASCM